MSNFGRAALFAGLLTALSGMPHVAGAVPQYRVIPVSTPGTFVGSPSGKYVAYGMNNLGWVTGYVDRGPIGGNGGEAFLWKPGVGFTDIGEGSGFGWTINSSHSYGVAVNDSGLVAVNITPYYDIYQNGAPSAARWNNGLLTTIAPLGTTAATISTVAHGISPAGIVVGESLTDNCTYAGGCETHGFSSIGGPSTDLGFNGAALNMNGAGTYVGARYLGGAVNNSCPQGPHPEYLRPIANGVDLDTCHDGFASDINELGVIVGTRRDLASSHIWAWNYSTNQPLVAADILAAQVNAVNNAGDVVGQRGFGGAGLWSHDGNYYDLDSLVDKDCAVSPFYCRYGPGGAGSTGGLNLNEAVDINESGQILVRASDISGFQGAVILDPIDTPEPSSLLLLAGVLPILASRRRWRGRPAAHCSAGDPRH